MKVDISPEYIAIENEIARLDKCIENIRKAKVSMFKKEDVYPDEIKMLSEGVIGLLNSRNVLVHTLGAIKDHGLTREVDE